MCCLVCLWRGFCAFCCFFISGCSIYLTMLFLSQNHVVISQGIVCLLIWTSCRQLSDKTWGWNFVSSAARRCYFYFRFFSSWLFPLRRLLQRFDLCYSVTFRGCRNITQVFWKFLLLHKTKSTKSTAPGCVWRFPRRCLRSLWEQHPWPQQIHRHTGWVPGDAFEYRIEGWLSWCFCILKILGFKEAKAAFFQDLCSQNSQCYFFTHFSTQCYLLAECGASEQWENKTYHQFFWQHIIPI